jgi:phytoene dehydrogenase-like protein
MVASLEKFIPGLASRTEFVLTGTPYTLNTRTSNYQGAIMGWSYDRTKTLDRGSLLQMAKSVRTPVPNLYMAGHWAFSPGGSPVAVMTGKLAANQILKATGKK